MQGAILPKSLCRLHGQRRHHVSYNFRASDSNGSDLLRHLYVLLDRARSQERLVADRSAAAASEFINDLSARLKHGVIAPCLWFLNVAI